MLQTSSQEVLKGFADRINGLLADYYPSDQLLAGPLNLALTYSRRRLRASLVYMGAGLLGRVADEQVDNLAMAYEIITANYVVLDDSVILDAGVMRADKPTPRVEYSEADALFAAAILQLEPIRLLPDDTRQRELFIQSATDTILGLKHEEDLVQDGKSGPVEAERIIFVARWLTGPLLIGPLLGGAMLAGASEDQLESLENYALAFGTAYQLTDHIIDVMGADQVSGKDGFSDVYTRKPTLMINHAREHAVAQDRVELERILGTMPNASEQKWLQELFVRTGSVDYTFDQIRNYNQRAQTQLSRAFSEYDTYYSVLFDLPDLYLEKLQESIVI